MRPYKKPDLNAPRFRPKKLNILKQSFYEELITRYPEMKKYSYDQVKQIVITFNELISREPVLSRDGVEFPKQLGFCFVGTCSRKKRENTDWVKSAEYGVAVQNQNWETDHYIGKIFYTNYENKYNFRFHHLWAFAASKMFRKDVGIHYPQRWKTYLVVDNLFRVSRIFRNNKQRLYARDKAKELLEGYDEFDLT